MSVSLVIFVEIVCTVVLKGDFAICGYRIVLSDFRIAGRINNEDSRDKPRIIITLLVNEQVHTEFPKTYQEFEVKGFRPIHKTNRSIASLLLGSPTTCKFHAKKRKFPGIEYDVTSISIKHYAPTPAIQI